MLTYKWDIFCTIFVIKCVTNLVPQNKDYPNPFGLLGVMMMIGKQFLCVFTVFMGLTVTGVQAAGAVVLTMGSAAGDPGETVTVNISVDQPEGVAAAAFTLNYNTTWFTLTSVESTFFDTFLNQWISLNPLPSPFPPVTATVDGQTYNQPLLNKTSSNKLLLAGARVKAGLSQTALFTLHFTVAANTPAGVYPVTITPTLINNAGAGYSTGGEAIPVLMGAVTAEQDLSKAFPAINPDIVSGALTVQAVIPDTDGDGIDDNWEMAYFGNLTTANSTSDFDGDGYTDLQEYLNQLAGLNDPEGNPFDPKAVNAPGGTGYNSKKGNSSFWLLMRPVLLQATQAGQQP